MAVSNERSNNWFIYFAVITTCLSAFGTGACFSWTSPLLPKFLSPDPDLNPIGHPATITESAWIVSAMSFGLIFGPLVSIVCLKFFTKKTVLLIAIAPILVAHVVSCFASDAFLFIFARLLQGVGVGVVWTVLGTFIAEISEDKNRGLLGSIPGTMSNLGSLFVYVIGPYVGMVEFSVAVLSPLVLFYIGFCCFVPDSPYDLLMKNRRQKAENSLQTLRRLRDVKKELTFMEKTIQTESGDDDVRVCDLLKDRGLRKGLLICVALMTFQQLSGILPVVAYAETIFQLGDSAISSSIPPMILGTVATIGNLIGLVLVDKMGRKILLTASCILESTSLFSLGSYFYLLNSGINVSMVSWVPIVSLIVFMIAFNLALGMGPWIVTGEVFHSKVKPVAANITALANFTWSFIVTMCFPYMTEHLGMGWTFWIFALCMAVGAIFCAVVLPETKGKNFQEIQKLLKR